MRLIGTIMDMFMNIGLIIIVIIFQDQIKRFLVELGSHKRWSFINRVFRHHSATTDNGKKWILPVVYACMNMSKSKTGALIVIQQRMLLDDYEHSGDIIDANINTRLIENIFFKNSPLHDGAMIIAGEKNRVGRLHIACFTRYQSAEESRLAPPLSAWHSPGNRCHSHRCVGRNRKHIDGLQGCVALEAVKHDS